MAAGTLVSSGTSGSMPTGSGSERLCRASIHVLNNDVQNILTGTNGHIYTVLSVTFCEQNNQTLQIGMRVHTGASDIMLVGDDTKLPAYGTFVWNDKFVIEQDDILKVSCAGANVHIYVSYIDQNWV